MSDLDLAREGDLNDLESEWRRAYEACVAARADYERVYDCPRPNGGLIHVARLRMERAEALKVALMSRMSGAADSPIGSQQH